MSRPESVWPPQKPEFKQKPQIPLKSANSTLETPGKKKVLDIVSKFNQPGVLPSPGTPISGKRTAKRAPTLKPKPKVRSLVGSTQAPPLPAKRRQSKGGTLVSDVPDGSRSAPDGKEVEQQRLRPGSLLEPQCERNCTCVCHLHRPGMKLVWVRISEREEESNAREDEEKVEIEEEDDDDEEEEGDEELDLYQSCSSESEESENMGLLSNKERFKVTLDLIEGQLRRKSDPGPESILSCLRSMPQPLSHLSKTHSVSEEESIYEATLDLIAPNNRTFTPPMIQIQKSPPDIPPRTPIERARPVVRKAQALSNLVPPPSPKPLATDQSPTDSLHPRRRPPPPPPAKARSLTNVAQTSKDDGEGGEDENNKRKSGLIRQKSIDMEAHMPEDFLYQMYTETYISKEIRRQTVCRSISKTSADYNMDPRVSVGSGPGGSRCSPVPNMKQSTLWQDLPEVRDSGILERLTPEERKYQESMYEVLTSELSYLRSLRVLTEHFMESRDLNETLINRDKKTLFSNILRIREVSEKFFKDLEERLTQEIVLSNISDIISYHAQHNFPAYIDYVRNQIYQDKTYTSLMQTNTQFAAVIALLQESPTCQRLPFTSFLLLPFQRITRLKILIENILKRTAEGTPDEEITTKALDAVSKIIDECNTQVGKMKQMEELIEINKMLEFDKLKAVPIISQNRFLEKQGELQEMAKGGTLFYLKPKFSPVYLFLFNDLLILASKKGSERYVVMDHAHRSLVQAHAMGEEAISQNMENCFCLTLLENHQGRIMERLLKAPSTSDMHRWLAAFPNPEDPNRIQEEVIYEDWDCPQVQCVEKYVAMQADELNLEPPEIINVTRKTNEGWYEGSRLSDGQKGWFPVKNVLEITSEHMRRRNLRERYRVMQAASALTNKTRTAS